MSAAHLASIFGTEQDKVNCPFFFKIGACRHGERCSRNHIRPPISETVLLPHVYGASVELNKTEEEKQEEVEEFIMDMFEELAKFGDIDNIYVCENLGEHMVGHVFCRFYDEDDAAKAVEGLAGRYYAGRQLRPEFSPVTDFREGSCRQYRTRDCQRGGYCNFMHIAEPSRTLMRELKKEFNTSGKDRSRRRSRSRSPRRERRRYRSRSRDRGKRRRSRSRDYDDDRRRRRRRSRSKEGRDDRDDRDRAGRRERRGGDADRDARAPPPSPHSASGGEKR